jgi:hypothetical protein
MLRFNTEGCDIFMARSWRLREKACVYEEFSHRNSGCIIGKSSFFLSCNQPFLLHILCLHWLYCEDNIHISSNICEG